MNENTSCRYRKLSAAFLDGVDPKTGKRTGCSGTMPYCELLGSRSPFLSVEECEVCRGLPTPATLEALSADVIAEAMVEYEAAREFWPKGVQMATGEYTTAMTLIRDEVLARADELAASGDIQEVDREELLVGAALMRGIMLGWCLQAVIQGDDE